jgi:hypothetical protein
MRSFNALFAMLIKFSSRTGARHPGHTSFSARQSAASRVTNTHNCVMRCSAGCRQRECPQIATLRCGVTAAASQGYQIANV